MTQQLYPSRPLRVAALVKQIPKIEQLNELGAVLCATRKVTDEGWMPRARQVGITGHSIAPHLYIAIGLSGNFNHTAGVRSAGTIIAINTGPAAEIFQWADVGFVGEWQTVLQALIPEISRALA